MSDIFYIGYQDKVPKPLSKFIQRVMVLLTLLLIAGAWLLASKQKGFISSTYEYYQETEITGIMIKSPVPSIQVFWGTTADDKPLVVCSPESDEEVSKAQYRNHFMKCMGDRLQLILENKFSNIRSASALFTPRYVSSSCPRIMGDLTPCLRHDGKAEGHITALSGTARPLAG